MIMVLLGHLAAKLSGGELEINDRIYTYPPPTRFVKIRMAISDWLVVKVFPFLAKRYRSRGSLKVDNQIVDTWDTEQDKGVG